VESSEALRALRRIEYLLEQLLALLQAEVDGER
jgi:hypothetical protein